MRLIERLKESYQNGKKEKILLKRKRNYYFAINDGFQGEIFYNGIVRINQKLEEIPEPKGFLEEAAYTLGSR